MKQALPLVLAALFTAALFPTAALAQLPPLPPPAPAPPATAAAPVPVAPPPLPTPVPVPLPPPPSAAPSPATSPPSPPVTVETGPPQVIIVAPPPGDPAAGPPPSPDGSPPPPPGEEPPPEHLHPKSHFAPSIEGGIGYQNAYGIPMTGVDLSAAAAADKGSVRLGAIIGATFSTTDGGLHTTTTNIGPLIEGHFDRLRVGGGVRIGTFNVNRVTSSGSLFSLSAGLYARASVDLVAFDKEGDSALFLVVKGSLDTIGTALWGAGASLGARF